MVALISPEVKKSEGDEFDFGIQQYWNKIFEEARVHMEYELKECAKDAYDISNHQKGDFKLRVSMPVRLAAWITAAEGTEDWKYNRDFIKCYQRYMGQEFLGEPTYNYGS